MIRPRTSGRASSGCACEGRAHHQKLAHEDAERRQPGDRHHAEHEAPAEQRVALGQAADIGDPLRAGRLRDMADAEEDRRLGQAVHGHVQQAGEVGERAAHAEGEGDDPHVLDRRVREHAFDVAPPVEHERREHQRDQAHRDHQGARCQRGFVGRQQQLEAQQREQRDVEQQAREHGRDRGRALGMGVRQPGMQRGEADLGAVAQQQEDEGEVEQAGIEGGSPRHQDAPRHRVHAFADHRARRHVDEDRAEQRQRDADAAEDEVFPGGLERLRRAVDADHQHGGQRRDLDRDPHQPDVVRHQSEVHGEHQDLIHGVVEAQVDRREPARLDLVADVARAEHSSRERDEGVERDEYHVEIVDQQERTRLRARGEQRERCEKGQQAAAMLRRAVRR